MKTIIFGSVAAKLDQDIWTIRHLLLMLHNTGKWPANEHPCARANCAETFYIREAIRDIKSNISSEFGEELATTIFNDQITMIRIFVGHVDRINEDNKT